MKATTAKIDLQRFSRLDYALNPEGQRNSVRDPKVGHSKHSPPQGGKLVQLSPAICSAAGCDTPRKTTLTILESITILGTTVERPP